MAREQVQTTTSDVHVGEYQGGGLTKGTNWWGAFVVGLAGTILVTGSGRRVFTLALPPQRSSAVRPVNGCGACRMMPG